MLWKVYFGVFYFHTYTHTEPCQFSKDFITGSRERICRESPRRSGLYLSTNLSQPVSVPVMKWHELMMKLYGVSSVILSRLILKQRNRYLAVYLKFYTSMTFRKGNAIYLRHRFSSSEKQASLPSILYYKLRSVFRFSNAKASVQQHIYCMIILTPV